MIVGDPAIFAIESSVTAAYSRLSFRALGYFLLYIDGQKYGAQRPDATMLACSFDEVGRRLMDRGMHIAPIYENRSSNEIAKIFRGMHFSDSHDDNEFISAESVFISNRLVWAPDGDSAFDDGSYVLHFDLGSDVRIIAFKSQNDPSMGFDTPHEIILKANEFYNILKQWHDLFLLEWTSLPKLPD